jgi:hypothetical protein
MKLFTAWAVSAGMVLAAGAANAQMPGPHENGAPRYSAASDFDSPYGGGGYGAGPYAAVPPEAPGPAYGPALMPPLEVYTILRENGFSPLGIPHQRGLVYTIAVINRRGDDGRLVIDARNGRIIRFTPAYRMGDNFNAGMYGPAGPPPIGYMRGVPRPPAPVPMPVPRMASRTPPLPQAAPLHDGEIKPQAAQPVPEKTAPVESAPAQQSAAVQAKPADAPAPPQAAAPVVQPKPAVTIQPTQEMPKMQGLE